MANKIILKKSSVAAKAPVAGDLDFGELAINYTDSKLYFKKADGSIDSFTSAAASAPVTSVGGNIGAITDAQLLASIKNVDGTGSGLDADFLDGNSAAAFYLATNPNGYTSNTGTVTSVGATAPIVSSGGTTPSLSIAAANSTTNGYMTSAYASKLDGIAAGATANTGTVTGVTATAPVASSGGTAPVISMAAASSGVNGYMTGAYATKLDGIAAGATNVTNTNQLTNGAGYITSSGSITGNSGTVGGLSVHAGRNNEANKIVRTDANGYIQAGWINTDSGDSGISNRLARIYSSNDNYLRYSGLTDFKVHMSLSAKNNYSRRIDYTADANYHVGSIGHSGYGANETFHGGSAFFDIWSGTNYPSGTSHIQGFNALHYTTNSLGSTGGTAYGIQVAGQYNLGGELWSRGCDGGTFSAWRRQLDSSNYNGYSPTLTGSGASGTWGINITGRGYPRRSDGGDLNFYWAGQGGQPPWLWGGSDGANMYVYNPSNFSVNYATTSGSSTTATTATKLSTASGSAPSYSARAWVNFNGTGVVAIRASGNVSSITDNGTGFYTVNFSTGMPDTNYAIVGFATNSNNTTPAGNMTYGNDISAATGSVTVKTNVSGSYLLVDSNYACLSVYR